MLVRALNVLARQEIIPLVGWGLNPNQMSHAPPRGLTPHFEKLWSKGTCAIHVGYYSGQWPLSSVSHHDNMKGFPFHH